MNFYVRELPQKQYHCQYYDCPELPRNKEPKQGDIWCSIWYDYHIDKVNYMKGIPYVYATATRLDKARTNVYYKRNKKEN